MRAIRALFVAFLFAWAVPLAAQEADVLTGRVTGIDGKALAGARVEAMSIETEITRSVLTDTNGRYTILFPDGGGAYLLRISFLGMAPAVKTLVREGAEELLLMNVTLEPQAITLDAIQVTGERPPPGQGDSGEQSTELTSDMLNRLPLPDLDPNTLALLAAGVTGTEVDSLTGRLGFSVAGMSDLLNQITIDGMIVDGGALNVPEEGLRQTRVTTSTFDVSRGGFAGGQVSMTSARGNNRSAGSLSYRFDGDALQFSATPSSNAFTNHNLSGAWGGPLIANRLFYNVSFGVSNNTQHLFSLSADDPLAAERSGVAVDSISRFMNILGGTYGLPTGSGGAYDNATKNYSFQGRFDWNVFQRQGQSQTIQLTVRKGINSQDSTRIRATELTQHAGETERDNHSVGVNLTSRFGRNWTNGLRFSYSENWNESQPFFEIPEGVVRVTSDFEDGTRQTSSITFGGNRSMPQESYSRNLQLSEDLSFLLPVGDGLHRLKVGGSLEKSRNINRSTSNIFGSFTYNSIEDFEANRPSAFNRSLTERNERSGTFNGGIYVGDTWRVSNPLEITLGLRWDYTKLDQKPEYNPAIEQAFGRRTDIEPVSTSFSPRIGFNYRLNQQGQPARSFSGGLGLFAGRAPTNIFSAATRQTGLPNAEQSLRCIGDVVPVPDWDLYMQDPDAIPLTCADGGPGVPDAFSSRAPNVTLIDPNQSSPSSLRADLGYRLQLPARLNGNFRYQYSRGLGLWGYRDINLDESQTFTLAGEGRPFFGDPTAIVQSTGAVSMSTSRIDDDFGNVYDVISDRESATHQVTAQLGGYVLTRLMFNANYTLGFSRDQGSQSFAGATTDGNPNEVEWGTASNDRRHTLNLTLSYPITPEIEITALGRISSGSPFTPMVNRDINGDGARNDRAFIPDPTTADAQTADAMYRLLENVPGRVRDCIESQLGKIAQRNSCRNGWSQGLDMRLGLRPNLPTFGRRLTVSVNATNVLTGLDQLINGSDNMKNWGNSRGADSNLLEVDGFDPVRNGFIYEVNEGFGQVRRGSSSFGRGGGVFSLRLEGRLAIGGNPGQSNRGFGPLAGGRGGRGGGGFGGGFGGDFGGGGGGRGGFGGGAGGLGAFASAISADGAMNVDSVLTAMLPNPVVTVLAMKDTLSMTPTQVEIVTIVSDTLDARLARRREALTAVAQEILPQLQEALANAPAQPPAGGGRGGRGGRGGNNPFAGNAELNQRYQLEIQPHVEGGQRETREALGLVQRELSPEQWSMIPEAVRNAGQVQAGGGRGNFNAVAVIDRMLVNPIPVLLELKGTLEMTPEQVAQLETISSELQTKLNERRSQLGQRFDNVPAQQQLSIYQEVQPQIDEARTWITEALRAAERVLTSDQWKQVPEQVRNPFTNQGGRGGPGGGGRGRRGGGDGDLG